MEHQAMIGHGEHHAYLFVNGLPRKGNYIGPGTDILNRLRRGDQPVTGADKVAKAHDLRYTLARGDPDLERSADLKMINKLRDSSVDNRVNRAIGRIPIQLKNKAEDYGLLRKGTFSKGPELSTEDNDLVQTHLDDLEKEGFGKPGSRLRRFIRGGALPQYPPGGPMALPVIISEATQNQIRQIAAALNVPHRADEWLYKENAKDWLIQHGATPAEAIAATFGDERPWDGVINTGNAEQVKASVPGKPSPVADSPAYLPGDRQNAPTKKRKAPAKVSKEAFLERMKRGREAAKKRKKGTTKRKATKKRFTPNRRRAVAGKLRKVLKKVGKGIGLAGMGLKLAGEGFELPESVTSHEDAARHLKDHMAKTMRITLPDEIVTTLGEEMSGMGMNWEGLESRLSGVKQLL